MSPRAQAQNVDAQDPQHTFVEGNDDLYLSDVVTCGCVGICIEDKEMMSGEEIDQMETEALRDALRDIKLLVNKPQYLTFLRKI